MFKEIKINHKRAVSQQIRDYIKELILKGIIRADEKLPSTRELCSMINVSRNSVLKAYEDLEDDGFIKLIKNKGAYVLDIHIEMDESWSTDWKSKLNKQARIAEQFDLIKNTIKTEKRVISFRGVAPDRSLFDIEGIKRAFLNAISKEDSNILNYGYAKGYKPLSEYLLQYMRNKGLDTRNKDILVTNGFTEGIDTVLSTICEPGDKVICENPTHNTVIKIMKMHELDILGVDMEDDGVNIEALRETLKTGDIKLGYFVPSYHNPTGIVMSPEKRIKVYSLFKEYDIPIIEDGFCEELRYSGAHIPPIAALSGSGNGVVYIGSFSKVLFPGIRVGWILGDSGLISALESVKKSRNIHTSFLDQAILYEYLREGNLDKCIRKSRRLYGERYEFAVECAKKNIPCEKITGDGGMYIFIKLGMGIDTHKVLSKCYENGVIFMPGDIFYVNGDGRDTMRLSFANVSKQDIEVGFKVIGGVVNEYLQR